MRKTLLFGGTFDPPHKGHLHLLRSAMEHEQFDRIILIPAFIPPHKDHKPALSFEARKGVLEDWFAEIPGLEISDLEEQRGGRSFTVDTVETLLAENPQDELYLLVGSDMFLSFETWRRFEDLLQMVKLIVGSREIGDFDQLKAYKNKLETVYTCKGIILCNMEPIVCASSSLRASGNGLAHRVLEHIGNELDVKRTRHTMQVADYAKKLSVVHDVDAEKAYLAGLLHDCTKCYPTEWHLHYAAENSIELKEEDLACPQVLHQITGAVFAEKELGASDSEILSAISCHTTGKAMMTPLEMLLFFADSCEPSRNYPGVEALRTVGEADLKQGTLMLIEHLMAHLNEKNAFLHPKTKEAKESLLKELGKNG